MKKNIHETFEEFWQNSGLHLFPVSPGILERQRKQHEKHLRYLDECDFFEPAEIAYDDSVSGNYNRSLYQLFEIDCIEIGEIYVLIKHSFEPEKLLIFSKGENGYECTCRKLKTQYWAHQYDKNTPEGIVINHSVWRPDKESGEELSRLLHIMLADARPALERMMILDGVKYYLFIRGEDGVKMFTKHSPPAESATGLCIAVFDQLIASIHEPENGSAAFVAALEALADKIEG